MFKNLDIYTRRYLQIALAYMLFVVIEQGFNLPHSSWIVIIGSMIYIGFNPGTVLKRAYLRLPGTFLGICAMSLMWYVIHFDYRMAIFFMVFIAWAMVYCFGMRYYYYQIIATLFSDIGIEWSNSSTFSLQYYIVDRTMYTLIVFGICIILEYFWFGRSNFSTLNYYNKRQLLLEQMSRAEQQIDNKHLTKLELFRLIGSTRSGWNQIRALLNDAKYEKNQEILTDTFPAQASDLYRKIVYIWHLQKDNPADVRLPHLRATAKLAFSELQKFDQGSAALKRALAK